MADNQKIFHKYLIMIKYDQKIRLLHLQIILLIVIIIILRWILNRIWNKIQHQMEKVKMGKKVKIPIINYRTK